MRLSLKIICVCSIPQWTKKPIPPGKKNEIKINYDTSYTGESITILFSYDDKKCVAQYNKETGRTNVSIPPNDDPVGIKNDVNNGMLFFKPGVILILKTTKNEWLRSIEAIKLKEYCNNKDVQGNLKDIVSGLKAEDNPVIMVVKYI